MSIKVWHLSLLLIQTQSTMVLIMPQFLFRNCEWGKCTTKHLEMRLLGLLVKPKDSIYAYPTGRWRSCRILSSLQTSIAWTLYVAERVVVSGRATGISSRDWEATGERGESIVLEMSPEVGIPPTEELMCIDLVAGRARCHWNTPLECVCKDRTVARQGWSPHHNADASEWLAHRITTNTKCCSSRLSYLLFFPCHQSKYLSSGSALRSEHSINIHPLRYLIGLQIAFVLSRKWNRHWRIIQNCNNRD